MIVLPSELKDYLNRLQSNCPSIESNFVLVDPSEIANFAKEEMVEEQICVFGLLPDVKPLGNNVDELRFENTLGLRIVEKSDYKSFSNQEEYLQVYERTANTLECIIKQLINDSVDPCKDCGILKKVDFSSMHIEPIWHESHCLGWDLEFEIIR